MAGGFTFTGPKAKLYRYRMLQHALRLEVLGMRSSGGAIRPRIAKELGLKPRDPRRLFIDTLDAKIKELCKCRSV